MLYGGGTVIALSSALAGLYFRRKLSGTVHVSLEEEEEGEEEEDPNGGLVLSKGLSETELSNSQRRGGTTTASVGKEVNQ